MDKETPMRLGYFAEVFKEIERYISKNPSDHIPSDWSKLVKINDGVREFFEAFDRLAVSSHSLIFGLNRVLDHLTLVSRTLAAMRISQAFSRSPIFLKYYYTLR